MYYASKQIAVSNHGLHHGLQTGDGYVLENLYRKAHEWSLRFLRKNKGSQQIAEQIADDTVDLLCKKIGEEKFHHRNYHGWIWITIRNKWFLYWNNREYFMSGKKQKQQLGAEYRAKLERCFPKMKRDNARILRYYFIELRSTVWISKAMRCKKSAVRVKLFQARGELGRVVIPMQSIPLERDAFGMKK